MHRGTTFKDPLLQLQDALIQDNGKVALGILRDKTFDVRFSQNKVHNLLSLAAKHASKNTLAQLAFCYAECELVKRLGDQTHGIHFEAAAGNDLLVHNMLEAEPELFFLASKGLYTPIELAAMAKQFLLVISLLNHPIFKTGNPDSKVKIIRTLLEVLREESQTAEVIFKLDICALLQQCLLEMVGKGEPAWNLLREVSRINFHLAETYLPTEKQTPAAASLERAQMHFNLDDTATDLGVDFKEYQQLLSYSHGYGLEVHKIERDGNCLFNAIADQLNHQGINSNLHNALSLRQLAVTHMRRHANRYRESIPGDFEEALKKSLQPGIFGDHQHLLAIARELNLRVIVFNSQEEMPRALLNVTRPKGTLCLGFEGEKNFHYHSLRFNGQLHEVLQCILDNTEIDPLFMQDKYAPDEDDLLAVAGDFERNSPSP